MLPGLYRDWGMKNLLSGIVIASVMISAGEVRAYESRGARSCNAWLEYRQDESSGYPNNAQVYQTWLVGYLSGIVAGSGMDFLAGTDNEVVYNMTDAFCGDNPEMNLSAAGIHVARYLMRAKGIVNRGTLP